MYIYRVNESVIHRSFDGAFVTALLGQRRVGKSTLVAHYAEQRRSECWVFLNMDNREERQKVENSQLKAIIQEAAQQQIGIGRKIWVAIDEAQKCPALFDQIKLLYDEYKDCAVIKFILTGSGFLSLHQLSAESLAGRIELYHLRDFSLKESCVFKKMMLPDGSLLDAISRLCDAKNAHNEIKSYVEACAPFRVRIEESLSEQIIYGGLPEVLQMGDIDARRNYLRNYLQTYLEKDIRSITTIADLNLYQKLMEIVAEQTGSIRQDREMIEALGCSRDTLKKYRGFLCATLVYRELYPFIGKALKRIVKSPKAYLLNNGLISYLTGIDDLNVLQKSGLIGHRFENWFLKELQIWLDRDMKRSEIYYWRTSGKMEVDFVVDKKPHVIPFEVTYSNRIQDKKVKNLVNFMQEEPKAKYGFYIYMGDFSFDIENNIFFIPAWAVG